MSPQSLEEEKPIITVKEARKIMGEYARRYTDEELKNLIDQLDIILCLQLKMVPNCL